MSTLKNGLIVVLGVVALGQSHAENINNNKSMSSGLNLGPGGISVNSPTGNNTFGINANRQGTSFNFSASGSVLGTVRSLTGGTNDTFGLPVIRGQASPPPSEFTDSSTFFRSIGRPEPSRRPEGSRPLAPLSARE